MSIINFLFQEVFFAFVLSLSISLWFSIGSFLNPQDPLPGELLDPPSEFCINFTIAMSPTVVDSR